MRECKEPFLKLIFEEAARQTGKCFIPDSAEGNGMENPPDGLEVEDWSGWLVDPSEEEFALDKISNDRNWMTEESKFDPVWVTWSNDGEGKIGIHFEILVVD